MIRRYPLPPMYSYPRQPSSHTYERAVASMVNHRAFAILCPPICHSAQPSLPKILHGLSDTAIAFSVPNEMPSGKHPPARVRRLHHRGAFRTPSLHRYTTRQANQNLASRSQSSRHNGGDISSRRAHFRHSTLPLTLGSITSHALRTHLHEPCLQSAVSLAHLPGSRPIENAAPGVQPLLAHFSPLRIVSLGRPSSNSFPEPRAVSMVEEPHSSAAHIF
jgi:hypothetical protein